MQIGQQVTVRLYGGETATRRVVAVKPDVVVVCHEDEYQSAMSEGREPCGLGFPHQDIVGPAHRKEAGSEGFGTGVSSKAGD
jgi:hypothetical protein